MAAEIAVLAEHPAKASRNRSKCRGSQGDVIVTALHCGTSGGASRRGLTKHCLNQKHLRAAVISTIVKCSLESDG